MALVVKSCIVDTPWIIGDRDRIIAVISPSFVCSHVVHRLQCYRFCDFCVPTYSTVFSDHKHVRFSGRRIRLYAPPKQLLVKMFAKRTADQVQCDRIDARVGETQTESNNSQHVPESVILVCGLRVVVKPQHENVMW